MAYKTKNYTAAQIKLIRTDDDASESYDLIKKISENYTLEDDTAISLDEFVDDWLKKKQPKRRKPKFKDTDEVSVTGLETNGLIDGAAEWDEENSDYNYEVVFSDGSSETFNEAFLKKVTKSKAKPKAKAKPKPKFKEGNIVSVKNGIGREYRVGIAIWDSDKLDYQYDLYQLPNEQITYSYEKDIEKVDESKPTPKTKEVKTKTKTGGKSKAEMTLELLELLENENNGISADEVEKIVTSLLNNSKFCYENLCDEVVEAIKGSRNVTLRRPKLPDTKFKNDIPNLLRIIDDIGLGNNVFLIGGAGTGKTYLAEKVASITGSETETINCNQFTSPIEINGGQTIEGYQEGKLIKAWSEGKLLILDELPKLDPNTAGILNEALAKTNLSEDDPRAYIVNTRGDRFKKKQGFAVIATGNVYPNTESTSYGANNKQDLSLLDRFGGSIYEIEKNPDFEKKTILPGHLFIWAIADKIRSLIEVNKWDAQVSIRLMQTSLRVYMAEMDCLESGESMDDRKSYKDVIDSFLWTFTEVQQIEIKRNIKYSELFEKFQYRRKDININPL